MTRILFDSYFFDSLSPKRQQFRGNQRGQLDPQSLAMQSVGALIESPLSIAGKWSGTFVAKRE